LPRSSPDPEIGDTPGAARLDRWLWAMRVFKTRPLALAACRRGEVEVNGLAAKPGRDVHPGETVSVRLEAMTRTLRVAGIPRSRVGAKAVPQFCAELTPASEFEKQRERGRQRVIGREPGLGRPTKRERRELDRFFG
jgi:ribosome-associated heat shock protein Hsp15